MRSSDTRNELQITSHSKNYKLHHTVKTQCEDGLQKSDYSFPNQITACYIMGYVLIMDITNVWRAPPTFKHHIYHGQTSCKYIKTMHLKINSTYDNFTYMSTTHKMHAVVRVLVWVCGFTLSLCAYL